MDNHTKLMNLQSDQGEIAAAVMELKNGDIDFSDFFSFCQSFNPDVTPEQVIKALETC
jgi:hypothetical protein